MPYEQNRQCITIRQSTKQSTSEQSGYILQYLSQSTLYNANVYFSQAANDVYSGLHIQVLPEMNFLPLPLPGACKFLGDPHAEWNAFGVQNKKLHKQIDKLCVELCYKYSRQTWKTKRNWEHRLIILGKLSNTSQSIITGFDSVIDRVIIRDKYTIKAFHNDEVKIQLSMAIIFNALRKKNNKIVYKHLSKQSKHSMLQWKVYICPPKRRHKKQYSRTRI